MATAVSKRRSMTDVYKRQLLADTDEKVRKMIFEAENKAALAKGIFEDQVKKAAVHRQHMMSILEGQMELLKNFSEDTEK